MAAVPRRAALPGKAAQRGGEGGGGGAMPLLGLASPCEDAAQCVSGACVDGVCCASACDELCESCAAATPGQCAALPAGTDPDDDCAQVACDGAGACSYAEHRWSTSIGGPLDDVVRDVAVDSAGNLVLVGELRGLVSFGGVTLNAGGDDDAFIAKVNPDGGVIWARLLGETTGSSGQQAFGVTVDAQDRIVVVGNFSQEIDIGDTVHQAVGAADIFVAQLDANGAEQWSRVFGPTTALLTTRQALLVELDSLGSVYIAGRFKGQIDFGGAVIDGGHQDSTFIAKLNASGDHIWSGVYGVGDSPDEPRAMAVQPDGSVTLCGVFRDTMSFGGGMDLPSFGGDDIFVAQLDGNGGHRFSHRFGDTDSDTCNALAVDSGGDVWLAGSFASGINFGGGDRSASGRDAYLLHLDAAGEYLSDAHWAGRR